MNKKQQPQQQQKQNELLGSKKTIFWTQNTHKKEKKTNFDWVCECSQCTSFVFTNMPFQRIEKKVIESVANHESNNRKNWPISLATFLHSQSDEIFLRFFYVYFVSNMVFHSYRSKIGSSKSKPYISPVNVRYIFKVRSIEGEKKKNHNKSIACLTISICLRLFSVLFFLFFLL